MLLLYHSHKHISYPIRTIARSAIPFYITEITRKAVLARATSIIISHNQPGGTVKPSERDKAMTKNLASACATIGIKLADHIIVAGNNYFSFKEKGLL